MPVLPVTPAPAAGGRANSKEPQVVTIATLADAVSELCAAHERQLQRLVKGFTDAALEAEPPAAAEPVEGAKSEGEPQPPALELGQVPLDLSADGELAADSFDEDALERWGELTAGLLLRAAGLRKPLVARDFVIKSHWSLATSERQGAVNGLTGNMTGIATIRKSYTDHSVTRTSTLDSDEYLEGAGVLWRLLVLPSSVPRMVWSCLGLVLLSIDAVTLPLQVFDLGNLQYALDILAAWSLVYWAVDLVLSGHLGFVNEDGIFEVRPSRVRQHYLKTWFFVDLFVLVVDVTVYVFMGLNAVMRGVQSVRLTRLLRMLRLVRLLRARRLGQLLTDISDRLGSQHMLLLGRMLKFAVRILVVNHYVACAWYAVADFEMEAGQLVNWVTDQSLQEESSFVKYIVSLHWSMTQFSPSTQNVHPTTGAERLFASLVTLIAMLVFSTLISGITNAVQQLRTVNSQHVLEEARIRDFLSRRDVPATLFVKILRYFKRHYVTRQARVHEHDVKFFSQMPVSLLIELRVGVFQPRLMEFQAFDWFSCWDGLFFRTLSHQAVVEKFYFAGQDIFVDCTHSLGMYFAVSGAVCYSAHLTNVPSRYRGCVGKADKGQRGHHTLIQTARGSATPDTVVVQMPQEEWFADMSVWVNWVHIGRAFAAQPTETLHLDDAAVPRVLTHFCDEDLYSALRTLAVLVASYAEEATDLSDLPLEPDVWADLCKRAQGFSRMRRAATAQEVSRMSRVVAASAATSALMMPYSSLTPDNSLANFTI